MGSVKCTLRKEVKNDINKYIDTEFINIIVLATKKDYPYIGKKDFLSILSWIYSIPADQRVIVHESTVVK